LASIMPNEGQILMSVERLMLDAKKAILEEQHRRLQILREEGRWEDLLQQLPATLSCAADVLQHSLGMLQTMADEGRLADRSNPSDPPE
jgi:hypothetical protein